MLGVVLLAQVSLTSSYLSWLSPHAGLHNIFQIKAGKILQHYHFNNDIEINPEIELSY